MLISTYIQVFFSNRHKKKKIRKITIRTFRLILYVAVRCRTPFSFYPLISQKRITHFIFLKLNKYYINSFY